MLGVNCRHILLYNLGLQQLFGGKPTAAFDSFLEVVQVYHSNPRLWLRLAEACIACHAKVERVRERERVREGGREAYFDLNIFLKNSLSFRRFLFIPYAKLNYVDEYM